MEKGINIFSKFNETNPRLSKSFFYLGASTLAYWGLKLAVNIYKSFVKRESLNVALSKYKSPKIIPNEKNTVMLVCLDYNNTKALEVCEQVMSSEFNIILVVSEDFLDTGNFKPALEILCSKYQTFYRLISYSRNENMGHYAENLEEEIKEVKARLMIILNECYSGSMPFGITSYTMDAEEMEYINVKLKLYTLIVIAFIKANNKSNEKLKILLQSCKPKKNTGDDMLLKSFMFYLESVKGEEVRLDVKTLDS